MQRADNSKNNNSTNESKNNQPVDAEASYDEYLEKLINKIIEHQHTTVATKLHMQHQSTTKELILSGGLLALSWVTGSVPIYLLTAMYGGYTLFKLNNEINVSASNKLARTKCDETFQELINEIDSIKDTVGKKYLLEKVLKILSSINDERIKAQKNSLQNKKHLEKKKEDIQRIEKQDGITLLSTAKRAQVIDQLSKEEHNYQYVTFSLKIIEQISTHIRLTHNKLSARYNKERHNQHIADKYKNKKIEVNNNTHHHIPKSATSLTSSSTSFSKNAMQKTVSSSNATLSKSNHLNNKKLNQDDEKLNPKTLKILESIEKRAKERTEKRAKDRAEKNESMIEKPVHEASSNLTELKNKVIELKKQANNLFNEINKCFTDSKSSLNTLKIQANGRFQTMLYEAEQALNPIKKIFEYSNEKIVSINNAYDLAKSNADMFKLIKRFEIDVQFLRNQAKTIKLHRSHFLSCQIPLLQQNSEYIQIMTDVREQEEKKQENQKQAKMAILKEDDKWLIELNDQLKKFSTQLEFVGSATVEYARRIVLPNKIKPIPINDIDITIPLKSDDDEEDVSKVLIAKGFTFNEEKNKSNNNPKFHSSFVLNRTINIHDKNTDKHVTIQMRYELVLYHEGYESYNPFHITRHSIIYNAKNQWVFKDKIKMQEELAPAIIFAVCESDDISIEPSSKAVLFRAIKNSLTYTECGFDLGRNYAGILSEEGVFKYLSEKFEEDYNKGFYAEVFSLIKNKYLTKYNCTHILKSFFSILLKEKKVKNEKTRNQISTNLVSLLNEYLNTNFHDKAITFDWKKFKKAVNFLVEKHVLFMGDISRKNSIDPTFKTDMFKVGFDFLEAILNESLSNQSLETSPVSNNTAALFTSSLSQPSSENPRLSLSLSVS